LAFCRIARVVDKLTVHILAAVAQHEREMISERTKAALKAARARETRLGNPRLDEAAKRGTAALKAWPGTHGTDHQGWRAARTAASVNATRLGRRCSWPLEGRNDAPGCRQTLNVPFRSKT
jgi:hypothetical protein